MIKAAAVRGVIGKLAFGRHLGVGHVQTFKIVVDVVCQIRIQIVPGRITVVAAHFGVK